MNRTEVIQQLNYVDENIENIKSELTKMQHSIKYLIEEFEKLN